MDIQTSLQLLLNEIGKGHPDDLIQAKISLFKAMDFLKGMEFEFNQDTVDWVMTAGQQEYTATAEATGIPTTTLPLNIVRPRVVQFTSGSHWYPPLMQKNISIIRDLTYNDSTAFGYPSFYAWWNKRMFIYPIPRSSFDSRLDYIKDVDRPRFRWTGSLFAFEQKNPTTFIWEPISNTYTNEWLEEAESLVRAWAKWDLYLNFYKNPERAEEAGEAFNAEKIRIRTESASFDAGNMSQEATVL